MSRRAAGMFTKTNIGVLRAVFAPIPASNRSIRTLGGPPDRPDRGKSNVSNTPEEQNVTILNRDGTRRIVSNDERIVDLLLAHRELIGDRRWGIVNLYYRAGLSMKQVADVFGMNKQMVSYELRRAVRELTRLLVAGEGRRTQQSK
jgi:hypothetical protein